METSLLILLLLGGAFVVSLFFESIRDYYVDALEIVGDGISSFFSFEWAGEMFSNFSELSVYGLGFGFLGVLVVFLFRNQMLNPFLDSMPPTSKIVWGIGTYIGTFIAGYFIGKYFQNTG